MYEVVTGSSRAQRSAGRIGLLLTVFFALAVFLMIPGEVRAATITVSTAADELNSDGDCSLREAVESSNTDSAVDACTAGSGADQINVPAGTYVLSLAGSGEDGNATGDLDVNGDVTFAGSGEDVTAIDGNDIDRVFHFVNGSSTSALSDLTVRGGGGGVCEGAGILSNATLTVDDSIVSNNAGGAGGGINNGGTMMLNDTTVTENTSVKRGGGISNSGTMTLNQSTVSSNDNPSPPGGGSANDPPCVGMGFFGAGGIFSDATLTLHTSTVTANAAGISNGGGVYSYLGTLSVVQSTISGNTAFDRGGGSFNNTGATATIENSTVSGNTAQTAGGGFSNDGTLTIDNSTISNNVSFFGPGGLHNTATLGNTILANSAGGDCSGSTISSSGYNLIEDTSGCTITGTVTGNVTGVDPVLGSLNSNGGPTQTHALLAGSPAIDAGSPSCPPPPIDQRGVTRPVGAACDIGAFELLPYSVPQSASYLDVSLVPAFRQTISNAQCSARGGTPTTHGPPFSVPSCDPPAFLPGTAAFFGPQSVGSAQLVVVPGDLSTVADEADDTISASLFDVRGGSPMGADYNPNPSGADTTLVTRLRISDMQNGPSETDPGTAADLNFSVPVNCADTVDPTVGAACTVSTTADAVVANAIQEGKLAVVNVFRVRLNDSGSDGIRGNSDDRNFAQQGIFNP